MKKRLLTGLQPSGALHIGNYFGALKPFVDLYNDYDSHLMVVDLHALTTLRDPQALRENIYSVVRDYIAVGVDPEKVILFKQSDVPLHTELAWIFECLVTVPFLMQAHAYKDKVAKGLEANAGLFNYPMLMAADILLYDAEVIPVGADQKQHVEYAREAATKFNLAYGETFGTPQELIFEGVGIIPGTDGQKMSKSYKNTIPLFGTKDEIAKAVMSIVTDSGLTRDETVNVSRATGNTVVRSVPFAKNLYSIHTLFKMQDEQDKLFDFYMSHENMYKPLKETLIEDIEACVAPMRERRASVIDSDVQAILKKGAEQAQERAARKMEEIHKRIGVSLT
jgi:tryptophanyl-tRNA synthetase